MIPPIPHTLAFGPLGWQELVVLAILGVLIFGKRLPEVGKSIGQGIVEFKKGLSGIDKDIDHAADQPRQPPRIEPGTTGSAHDTAHHEAAAPPQPTASTPPSGHSA